MLMGSDSCMSNDYNPNLNDPPRVLIVSRRALRKNKFIDFVGEYHLDLIVRYGAVPIIVPRVSGIHKLLETFKPIHGVLLCEGEDISPIHHDTSTSTLSKSDLQHIKSTHKSDTTIDLEKDLIELTLTRLCLDHNIPFLGICRGSQVLNVACGGTLYQDVEKELHTKVMHIDYDNYDAHRHEVRVVDGTPLFDWFGRKEVMVNSYHHQGVKRLGERFVPMAFAADGLVEGFYDPEFYDPEDGKFVVGLQFHPERMRRVGSDEFDYAGCPLAYQEFIKAVIAYQKKVDNEIKNRRKITIQCIRVVENVRVPKFDKPWTRESEVEAQQQFLESNMAMMEQKVEARVAARNMVEKMSAEELSELLSFYRVMGQICSDVLQRKILVSLDT